MFLKVNIQIFISSIILLLVGSLLHFAYDFFNNNFIVGLFTPINESVWEHLKLAFFPILFWWIVFYWRKNKRYNLKRNKWFLGCLVSIITSIIIILGGHYFMKFGLNIHSVLIDIILFYIAIFTGQYAGYHVYNFSEFSKIDNIYFPVVAIGVIIIVFIILTISPLKLPVFEDPKTNTYGIYKK
ncbi:MAG: hypothetical protein GX190_02175 [Mollicutes bacterium]|nr:hypothetical protein [Mollicutes bacterium]